MLGIIRDPTTVMFAIVLTGFEEVLLRSSMVMRDNFLRKIQGSPDLSEKEKAIQVRQWAASTAVSMYLEFSAIILCRFAFVVFRPHRFVVNLGYSV